MKARRKTKKKNFFYNSKGKERDFVCLGGKILSTIFFTQQQVPFIHIHSIIVRVCVRPLFPRKRKNSIFIHKVFEGGWWNARVMCVLWTCIHRYFIHKSLAGACELLPHCMRSLSAHENGCWLANDDPVFILRGKWMKRNELWRISPQKPRQIPPRIIVRRRARNFQRI